MNFQQSLFSSLPSYPSSRYVEIEFLFRSSTKNISRVFDQETMNLVLKTTFILSKNDDKTFENTLKQYDSMADKFPSLFVQPLGIYIEENTFAYNEKISIITENYEGNICELGILTQENILYIFNEIIHSISQIIEEKNVKFNIEDIMIINDENKNIRCKFDYFSDTQFYNLFKWNQFFIEILLRLSGIEKKDIENILKKIEKNDEGIDHENIKFLINSYLIKENIDLTDIENYLLKCPKNQPKIEKIYLNTNLLKIKNNEAKINFLKEYGKKYIKIGLLERGKSILENLRDYLNEKKDYKNDLFEVENDLAVISYYEGNYKESESKYSNMSVNNEKYETLILNNISMINLELSNDTTKYMNLLINQINENIKIDPELLSIIKNNIGSFYFQKSDYEKSLDYMTQSLNIKISLQNANNEQNKNQYNIGSSYSNISHIYLKIGNLIKASEFQQKELELIESNCSDSRIISKALNLNLSSSIFLAKGDYERALQTSQESLSFLKKLLKKDNPILFKPLSNVILSLARLNRIDEAFELLQNNIQTTNIVLLKAELYRIKDNYERYKSTLFDLYQKVKSELGVSNEQTLNIGLLLSKGYILNDEIDNAYEICSSIYEERRKIDASVQLAETMVCMAAIFSKKEDYSQAIEFYQKGIEVYKDLLGEKNEFCRICYKNIGRLFVRSRYEDENLTYYFEKSLKICKDLGLKELEIETQRELNDINDFLNQIRNGEFY